MLKTKLIHLYVERNARALASGNGGDLGVHSILKSIYGSIEELGREKDGLTLRAVENHMHRLSDRPQCSNSGWYGKWKR